tara:strand:+ start:592 stop:849 length:258 start_codon:yes stop_codon:yes gene_type:complete
MKKDYTKMWNKKAEQVLLGKRIVEVSYVSSKEAKSIMWYNRPISFTLDDGTRLMVQRDDEGNDGGALWYAIKDGENVLPVLGLED